MGGLGGFVGRQPEMARLRGALDEARAGRGRLVLLTGDDPALRGVFVGGTRVGSTSSVGPVLGGRAPVPLALGPAARSARGHRRWRPPPRDGAGRLPGACWGRRWDFSTLPMKFRTALDLNGRLGRGAVEGHPPDGPCAAGALGGDGGEIVDSVGVTAYRSRLVDLGEELAEARASPTRSGQPGLSTRSTSSPSSWPGPLASVVATAGVIRVERPGERDQVDQDCGEAGRGRGHGPWLPPRHLGPYRSLLCLPARPFSPRDGAAVTASVPVPRPPCQVVHPDVTPTS